MLGKGLGYVVDEIDNRDLTASDLLSVLHKDALLLPTFVDPLKKYTRTIDQGGLGSCTANAVAQAIRADQLQQVPNPDDEVPFMSRLFGYYFARACDHNTGVDTGAQIRNVFRSINTFGFPPEWVWPYDDSSAPNALFAKMPSADAMRMAFDQRLTAEKFNRQTVIYRRIMTTGEQRKEEVKRAIAANKLVVFGTDVSEEFCNDATANHGNPIEPPIGKAIAGGHAMVWGGYDEDGPYTLNSWGTTFGDGGWFQMTWSYVTWSRTNDLWIVERAPLYT